MEHAGSPPIGYVAEHGYGGNGLDQPEEICLTSTDIVPARFAQFSQP